MKEEKKVGNETILAIVGSTRHEYVDSLKKFLLKHGHVWSGWNYRILPRDEEFLRKQKKIRGYFNLYFHYRKRSAGSGNIEAIARVSDWVSGTAPIDSPEPRYTTKKELLHWKDEFNTPAKAWLKIFEIQILEKPINTIELNDFSTNSILNPSTLQARFAPVEDVFQLRDKEFIDEKKFLKKEKKAGKEAHERSDEELKKRIKQAQNRNLNPSKVEVIGTRYIRNPDVAEFAKRRAKGICQLCKKEAPFKDSNGIPYLEVHHIIWLSRAGEDTIENTVALCPNCHRWMHVMDLEEDKSSLQGEASMNVLI